MTAEDAKKLLTAVKASIGEGGIPEADAVKLVIDAFDADNRGLIGKRDELLANETKLKSKIAELETAGGESTKKISELTEQLKKSNPEEHKQFYEGQVKELTTKHETELAKITAERDRFQESHYTRLRDDAINAGTKDMKFLPGLRDGFIALAMLRNQFTPKEIDGKIIFTNQENKKIEAVLHELSMSDAGKAYIQNGNGGGGAAGGGTSANGGNSAGGAGKSMTRADFDQLSPEAKMKFMTDGGSLTAA